MKLKSDLFRKGFVFLGLVVLHFPLCSSAGDAAGLQAAEANWEPDASGWKRGIGSALRQLKGPRPKRVYKMPAWAFASMADADWGWKKRTDPDKYSSKDIYDLYKTNKLTSDYWKRFGQPFYQPYGATSYRRPYYGGSRRSPSSSYKTPYTQSSTSRSYGGGSGSGRSSGTGKDRQYKFHSMADMDWGWKKRKRSSSGGGGGQDIDDASYRAAVEQLLADMLGNVDGDYVEEEDVEVEKKSLASLAKSNDISSSRDGQN